MTMNALVLLTALQGHVAARDSAGSVPTIIVEAPSIWPGVVIGGLTLVVLALQWWVFRRQAKLMERQGEIMAAQRVTLGEQHALAEQQMRWRRDEAIGTFYRLAFDLAEEFRKANVPPTVVISADFGTHPRQMLREASRLFAPLGPSFVQAANQAALRLDEYFSAVEAYNRDPHGREGAGRLGTVQALRQQVGGDLDAANSAIPQESRWKYASGRDYNFHTLCSPPPGFPFSPEGPESLVSAP